MNLTPEDHEYFVYNSKRLADLKKNEIDNAKHFIQLINEELDDISKKWTNPFPLECALQNLSAVTRKISSLSYQEGILNETYKYLRLS